ncbi:hypothetical protein [Robertmurraya kyonggiensis]|uniref:Uncharacterized protein n=1 Tax=Robertmurraya kyonggiensis TaxID=1037680 RepID=A0A4U1D0Q7_9BACI|nr:hypothetical protein [Robertmurraya kyonggiensis]TKC15328.1 hypothetical protein FA727_18035 [Robertmurraya kyonggiensis]
MSAASDILASLPPGYPVDRVCVDGTFQDTTNFVIVNNGLAYFNSPQGLLVFNVSSIDGLDLTA